ncbi:M23 family metallopeptidase, partial [Patescibacteria group bacterium]
MKIGRAVTPTIFIAGILVAFFLSWLVSLPPRLNLAQLTVPQEEQTWQFPVYNWGLNYRDNYGAYSSYFNNYHAGEDWFMPAGTYVYAAANGVVKRVANYDDNKDYGGFVAIEHTLPDNSKVVSIYGHLDWRRIKVSTGQTISRGTHIGYLGTSQFNGNWTPHLHFGLRKGAFVYTSFAYMGYYSQAALSQDWLKPRDFIVPRLFDQEAPEISIVKPIAGARVDNYVDIEVRVNDPSGIGRTRIWASPDNGSTWFILHQSYQNTATHTKQWNVATKNDDTFKLIVDSCDRFTNCSTAPAQVTFEKDIVEYLAERRPAGSLLSAGGPAIYLLDQDRNIRIFPSYPIYLTHKRNRNVRLASQQEIDSYPRLPAVGFANGNLIRVNNTKTVYLITDSGLKRPFATATAFRRQGLSFNEVLVVTEREANYHELGPAIRDNSPLADGLFVKGSGLTVYYITDGKRRAIS